MAIAPVPDTTIVPDNTTTQTTPGIPPEMTYKDGDEFEDGGKPATHKTPDPVAVLGPKSQPDPIPPDPPEAIAPQDAGKRMPNPPPLPDPSTFQTYPGSGQEPRIMAATATEGEEEEEEGDGEEEEEEEEELEDDNAE